MLGLYPRTVMLGDKKMAPATSVVIRATARQRAWLEYTAGTNNRTQAAEVRALIDRAMKDDPLKIVVHEYNFEWRDRHYSVSVGHSGRDFFETPDREQAVKIAEEKAE